MIYHDEIKKNLVRIYKCLATPSHGMMLTGFMVDHYTSGHDVLCISSFKFDPIIFLHMVSHCPAMSLGMLMGVGYECLFSKPRRPLPAAALVLIIGFLAMYFGKIAYPMSHFFPFAIMVASMIVMDLLTKITFRRLTIIA
jgi:xanthosine utilization system XapX-like protein|tara:strand:+ start:979 stop:1398 length:420 start_codon:yes stop_codon:yes gene_type:complete